VKKDNINMSSKEYLNKNAEKVVFNEPKHFEEEKQKLDSWQKYLLSRRQNYLNDRKNSLGNEYFSGKQKWDMVFEREWTVVEERMGAGIGVDNDMMSLIGLDFFSDRDALLQELAEDIDLETVQTDEQEFLTIYTFEDFIMLSNQGIFRDEVFLIDPQRKWKKKVKEIITQYGYSSFDKMCIEEDWYIVVTR
tara:strand:+ start:2150 stop:2725 length:576 start_codon:yes stop_codon:yes gene_type:complete